MRFARVSGSSGWLCCLGQVLAQTRDRQRQRSSRASAIFSFLISVVGIGAIIGSTRVGPVSVTTCDAADPFDNRPDTAALQTCLDNYDQVLLEPGGDPGYVGYLINDTLKLRRPHALLTTGANPRKVTLLAAPELAAPSFALARRTTTRSRSSASTAIVSTERCATRPARRLAVW